MKPVEIIIHAPHLHPKREKVRARPSRTRKVHRGYNPNYGPELWAKLHGRALLGADQNEMAWLADFARQIPCGACRAHWEKMMVNTPPTLGDYFAWTVDRHNEVNLKLGKAMISDEEAQAYWTDKLLVNSKR
jgi:hypothetical protein